MIKILSTVVITRAQREALYRVYRRADKPEMTYREFRRKAIPVHHMDCVMVQMPNTPIWLGIETDGYTHS